MVDRLFHMGVFCLFFPFGDCFYMGGFVFICGGIFLHVRGWLFIPYRGRLFGLAPHHKNFAQGDFVVGFCWVICLGVRFNAPPPLQPLFPVQLTIPIQSPPPQFNLPTYPPTLPRPPPTLFKLSQSFR